MSEDTLLDPATCDGIAAAWDLASGAHYAPLGNGLINRTLLMTRDGHQFVLQHINTAVFTDPALLMHNYRTVTTHLARRHARGDYACTTLELVPTPAGESAAVLADGSWWRM